LDAVASGPQVAEKVAVGNNTGVSINNTGSVLDDGSVVAGEAGSGFVIPGGAEIADGGADIVGIEVPSLGAGGAYSAGPDGATDVGLGGGVDCDTFSVHNCVPLVTVFADSLLRIKLLAGLLYLAADSVFIEKVSA
jgi:hypothetical protein